MTKIKKRYITKEIPKKKSETKRTVALVLALIAIAFLLINALYLLMARDLVITSIMQSEELSALEEINVPGLVSSLISILAIVWLIFAVLMSCVTYFVEKGKWEWYILLIVSIITLATGRLEAAILGIVASILYKK